MGKRHPLGNPEIPITAAHLAASASLRDVDLRLEGGPEGLTTYGDEVVSLARAECCGGEILP